MERAELTAKSGEWSVRGVEVFASGAEMILKGAELSLGRVLHILKTVQR